MSNHEDIYERLESEFDYFLLEMKPYALKHPNKTGKRSYSLTNVTAQTSLVAGF